MDNLETKIEDIAQIIIYNTNYKIETLITAFELLVKLFQNIINNPNEDKFKNFKLTNEAIKTKILFITEITDLLKAIGYEKVNEESLTYKNTTVNSLEITVGILNKKLTYLEYKLTRPKSPPKKEELFVKVTYLDNLDAFNKEISSGVTAVDYTATWCGPCKMISPIFEKLACKYPNAKFFKVDVDKGKAIASTQNISAMPTFRIYKDGKQVGELVGASERDLKTLLDRHCL